MWIEVGIIVVLFVIILLIGTKDLPPYHETSAVCPQLIPLEEPDIIKVFNNDVVLIGNSWSVLHEKDLKRGMTAKAKNKNGSGDAKDDKTADGKDGKDTKQSTDTWTVFHLFGFNEWNTSNANKAQLSVDILKQIPDLVSAGFVKLDAGSIQSKHRGFDDLDNHVLRSYMLLTDHKKDSCGIWVNGVEKAYVKGKWLTADTSLPHSFFNKDKKPYVVLVVDIKRPEGMKIGKADSHIPTELEPFIMAL